uniref:Uncharacterized protein n=2 Tax=Gasterosteus aculeatus TaxID=69293 RepID=G3P7E3_GASAC
MSHDALLPEVARLEASLEDVRREVEDLCGCDDCRRLDGIQHAVREEVRLLFYGNQLSVVDPASLEGGGPPEGGGGFQEPLLQRYVSTAELQAALLALELRLLQNVSQQLEGQHGEEDAAGTALTQKDVEDIVTGALRLFSL